MKSNIILGSIILVLIVVTAGMGWMIYQNKVSDMDNRIAILNSQIVSLQSQNSFLQSQNSVLTTQANQLNADLSKSKSLKSFANVEDLRSFLASNAGYNFNSSVYDESDVCIKRMLAAQDRGYWMGLMPKQTTYFNPNLYYNNYNNDYYDSNTPWIQGDAGTYRFFNNYSSASSSYGGVRNVAVVNGRDLYAIESGVAVFAGSMSTGF